MNLNLPTGRGRFVRFSGLGSMVYGMGATLPYYCSNPECLTPGSNCGGCPVTPGVAPGSSPTGSWSSNAPTGNPVYVNIPMGGFTGDFQVETLDSHLAGVLAQKESPFIANAIAMGADSIANQAADIQAQADDYCGLHNALPDCAQKSQLVAKYQALYLAWGKGQMASTYQSGAGGSLSSPTNVLTGSAPTYTPPPVVNPVNVLATPQTGNPVAGSQDPTKPGTGTPAPPATDISAWLQANWVLVALGVGALILVPQLMKGGK